MHNEETPNRWKKITSLKEHITPVLRCKREAWEPSIIGETGGIILRYKRNTR